MQQAVKLASLRVGPELDASKYVAGAHAVEAANDGMAQSSLAAGSAVGQLAPKISEAGNVVARLSHQYVDGYGSAVRFQKGLDGLQRALETGNIEMAQAETILEGMHRRLGIMASAEDLAASGQHQLAAAAANANAKISAQTPIATGAALAQQRLGDTSRYAAMQQRNLVFQLNDVAVSLAGGMNPLMVFMQQGSQIATIYGPEEGDVGRALQQTGAMAANLVTKFWPIAAAVGTASAAIAGMTYEINQTGKVTVGFGDTALATWQVISEGIYKWIKPAIDAVAPWFEQAWDSVKGASADTVNLMVRGWMGFMANMEMIAGALPHIFDISWQKIYNGGVDLMEQLLESIWSDINKVLAALGQAQVKVDLSMMRVEEPKDAWSGPLLDRYNARKEQINSTDYAGQFFGAVSDRAQSNVLADMADDANKAGGAIKAANDNYGAFLDKVNEGQRIFESTRIPFEDLGAELGRLEVMLADGVISWDTYQRAASTAMTGTATSALSALGQVSGMLAQAFEDNKALAIANAVVKGGEAAVSSYAAGAQIGGPFIGAAFAAASTMAPPKPQFGGVVSRPPAEREPERKAA